MYRLRMFFLWLFENLSQWFNKHFDTLIGYIWGWGLIAGICFIWVDTTPAQEGFRFGWFYSLARIPTYLMLLSLVLCVIWLIADAILGWAKRQYRDYQAFVMSGGKHKPKNEDEEQ